MASTQALITKACRLSARIEGEVEARERRALWLQAVTQGATRNQIAQQCGISLARLDNEIRKAREETTDPALRVPRGPNRGATPGVFPCPHDGCRYVADTAQGLGMHRMRLHGYRSDNPRPKRNRAKVSATAD